MQETWFQCLGQEDPLEEGMATHSSIPAWRVPWTEEPGSLHGCKESVTTKVTGRTQRMALDILNDQCSEITYILLQLHDETLTPSVTVFGDRTFKEVV